MKRSRRSPSSPSMICASRVVPSVVTTSACVSPRVKSAEPWVRGSTPTFTVIGRTVVQSRPSMRGSPLRIRWRTMLLSSLKSAPSICSDVHLGDSPPARVASGLRLDLGDARMALLLLRDGCRPGRARPGRAAQRALASSAFSAGGCQVQRGLPASATSSRMARMAICICWWPNTTAPNITSSGRPLASDSTMRTPCSVAATTRCSCDSAELLGGGIEQVLAVLPTDPGRADRAAERNTGEGQRRGGAEERRRCPDRCPDRPTAPSRRPALRYRSRPGRAVGSGGR